jgi:uncharacterized protein YprB with RNaseH-like and TPR domain
VIRSSFRLTPGVGAWLESRLWDAGVRTWADLPEGPLPAVGPKIGVRLREAVARAREALEAGDAEALARMLPRAERWRLYAAFADDACFLDIETDGTDRITAIGLLDRDGPRVLLAGRDLDEFEARAARWKLLGTFNGQAFDVPVQPLGHLWRRLGHAGGLKALEVAEGLHRPPHLAGLSGLDAVRLWHAWQAGDPGALRLLAEYNLYDAVHLRTLMDRGYNRMLTRLRLPAAPVRVAEPGDFRYDVSKALLVL